MVESQRGEDPHRLTSATVKILGLHHITLICSDAARTVDFYTRVLGLRLIKKTVNFDDPSSYHIYFGDRAGTPGTVVTFFEWPHLAKGRPGIGGTHHVALTVQTRAALLMWKRRLTDLKLKVQGPFDRIWFHSIYFQDPDGVQIEIATVGPGVRSADLPHFPLEVPHEQRAATEETWPDSVETISEELSLDAGMHHISAYASNLELTHRFYGELLGLTLVLKTYEQGTSGVPHWFWGNDRAQPGSLISYFEFDPAKMKPARIGVGQTHHFALSVPDEQTQLDYRERLLLAGLRVSPVMNRVYFKSIYTADPDGHIVELATAGPGFTTDEPLESLGNKLCLPPWLEPARPAIEHSLKPLPS